jgi:plasmid stabilization system protein ParE
VTRVKWSGPARRDIERIRLFLEENKLDSYPEIASEIVTTARVIALAPKAAPFVGSTFTRKRKTKRYPYLLFYRIEGPDIWITRVRHSAQDWLSEYE